MKTSRASLLVSLALSLLTGSHAEDVPVKGTVLDLRFTSEPSEALSKVARRWVENSAKAVAAYYGSLPAKKIVLRVSPTRGQSARGGHANDEGGTLGVTIALGSDATEATLADDWILTHEMLHLCFPSLPARHHWLEEGLATYVEPFARARAGLITAEDAWAGLVEGAPKGQPKEDDRGLDGTPTWGRTYWGGAVFCLRADVEIRRRTGNKKGLEHALRAIAAAGGTLDQFWKMDRVIAVADGATGVPVFRELYDEGKDKPVTVDLPALWKSLGIEVRGRTVRFHDDAPLAEIRKAITAP